MGQLLLSDRLKGALWGFIVGDAFGLPIKNQPREHRHIYPIDVMTGWGTYNLSPGHWSDESSIMLCAVQAEVNSQLSNQTLLDGLKDWYYDGIWSSTGKVIEVSEAVRISLQNYISNWNFSKEVLNEELENGSDLAGIVIPVLFSNLRSNSIKTPAPIYAELTKNIYNTPLTVMGLTLFHLILLHLLQGKRTSEVQKVVVAVFKSQFAKKPYKNYLKEFAFLEHLSADTSETELISDTSIINALQCVVWAMLKSTDFISAIKYAANLGGYTDGISAMTGALAGAAYGIQSIPEDWINYIVQRDSIHELFRKFIKLTMQPVKSV